MATRAGRRARSPGSKGTSPSATGPSAADGSPGPRALLEEAGADRPERGWVQIIKAFSEPDALARESLLREAIAIGRRFRDPDVEFLAMGYLGSLFVMTDRVEEVLVLSDEALAALCAGELSELAAIDEEDLLRALLGMRAGQRRLPGRPVGPGGRRPGAGNVVAAFCRAHYGGILTAAGRWPEAESRWSRPPAASTRGCRGGATPRSSAWPARPPGPPRAGQLLEGLDQHPDVVPALAALQLARGRVALANDLLERATEARTPRSPPWASRPWSARCSPTGRCRPSQPESLHDAEQAARRLRRIATAAQHGPFLQAAAALAEGQVLAASGQGDARAPCTRRWKGSPAACPWRWPGPAWRWRVPSPDAPRGRRRRGQGGAGGVRTAAGGPARRRRRRAAALARRPVRTGPKGSGR